MPSRFALVLTAFVVGLGCGTVPAFAQSAPNSQQEKMKSCNADANAKNLLGEARRSFMADCLKSKPASTLNSQQQKMKTCNERATTQKLTGDVRKTFMGNCLKGS